MKFSYVARQPILDQDKKTVAYELLFRDGPKNTFPEVEPELATSRLLSDQFLTAHYHSIEDKLGFVNFPYSSLVKQVPTLFPNKRIVVEILEDCPPNDELFRAVKTLHSKGYTLALDDFVPSPEWKRFLPYIAIIKFDIRVIPVAKAARFIQRLDGTHIEFLAEKVETYEEYEQARAAGFTMFQGYFFSKPEILQQKAIEPSFLTVIQLCSEVAQNDINYADVERIITQDVSLSYKLLRYVNSSVTVSAEIKSFRQALVYLGQERLRKFVSLVAIATMRDNKPDSLYSLSLQRARLCELLLGSYDKNEDRSQAFLTGMFSLLDSLMDQPLDVIIESVPLDSTIKDAILHMQGLLGQLLSLVIAYEKADWDQVNALVETLGLDSETVSSHFEEATLWADEVF